MGRGYPPPQPTRGVWERHKLPQRGPGRSPGRKRFILLFRRDIRPLVAIFVCNSFSSPPPSSTPLRGLNPLFAVSTVLYFKIRVRSGLVSFWARIFWILLRLLISIKCDILSRRNSVCGKVKLIMCCYFNNCDPVVRLKLLRSYCCDFYGCVL